jgi:hypothetical protein
MSQPLYHQTAPDTHNLHHQGNRCNEQSCSRKTAERLPSGSQVINCGTQVEDPLFSLSALLHRVAEEIDSEMASRSLLASSLTSQANSSRPLYRPNAAVVEAAVQVVTSRLRRYLKDEPACDPFLSVPVPGSAAAGETLHQVTAEDPESDPISSRHSQLSKSSGAHSRSRTYHELNSSDGPTQHTLKLCLLGRPQVYIDGVRVAELERSNRRTQVIQLLALHRGSLSCDRLAEALCTASHLYEDQSLNPHYVRNLVWGVRERIREKLGWGGIVQSPTRGGMGPHYYRLPDNTVCDLWEFEDKLDQADRLHARSAAALAWRSEGEGSDSWDSATSPANRAAAIREEALQLYKGEFCEGSNAGPIVQAARLLEERYVLSALQQGDYWRARALRARAIKREDVQDAPEAQGKGKQIIRLNAEASTPDPDEDMAWREALRNYERVTNVDNYHEEAYRRAMECYARLGNAKGVGQTFTRCQDVLHADLMQLPGEEVVRAYEDCKTLLGLS